MFWLRLLFYLFFMCFETSSKEFCISEYMSLQCSSNEIILIQNAIFGRKNVERCLSDEEEAIDLNKKDSRFLGCYSDVRGLIELWCAGRQSCKRSVVHIKAKTTCYNYLKQHLNIQHQCLKVVPDGGQCSVSVAKERQHVSSIRTKSDSCGTEDRPWKVDSMVGQRINVTLIQLIASNKTQNRDGYLYFSTSMKGHDPSCHAYAKVIDTRKGVVAAICHEETQSSSRTQSYLSNSNEIEIVFNHNRPSDGLQYLFTFEVTGCSNLIAPADAWIKRHDNKATVGCYTTRLRWHLECQGSRWIGVIGNCSYAHKDEVFFSEVKMKPKHVVKEQDQVVTVFGIVVIGLILCVLITCMGIVLLKRYYSLNKMRSLKNLPTNGSIQPTYNNFNTTNKIPYFDKNNLNDEGAYFPPEGAQQDNTHYFELDQALVNKQPPSI